MSMPITLETFLSEHGARYTLHHHAASISSVATAEAASVAEDDLAKSVLLEDEIGHVLAVLPASRRLKLSDLRDQLGRKLHLSHEADLESIFPDCELGALPPMGAAYGLATVVDRSLEGRDEVFFEAGDHETLVRMSGGTFLDLLGNARRGEFAYESEALHAAVAVRERLYETIRTVDQALGAPLGSGGEWQRRLAGRLASLRRALDDHICETEAPDGLLIEIEEQAPRLAREVDRLRKEHGLLIGHCERVMLQVEDFESAESLRRSVLTLLGRFAGHRHRGADLVYEAFGVDIGGG
jgi:Ala-tRNA(Pro) deacylase